MACDRLASHPDPKWFKSCSDKTDCWTSCVASAINGPGDASVVISDVLVDTCQVANELLKGHIPFVSRVAACIALFNGYCRSSTLGRFGKKFDFVCKAQPISRLLNQSGIAVVNL